MAWTRGDDFQAVTACMLSLAIVAVGLRLYSRLRLTKAFGWDDGWMIMALVTHIVFAVFVFLGVHYGYGQHEANLTSEQITLALRSWWICYILYCFTMVFSKISIGLFLLRITPKRSHYWIIVISIGCTIITGIIFLCITIFQCLPVRFLWDQEMREKGKCIDIKVVAIFTYLYSLFSALTDFAFGILPIVLVWNLNMSRRQKMALTPVLSLGCLACVAIIVRIAYIPTFITDDFLHDTVNIAIWSDVEQGLAITAGSLATLRPLYKIVAARFGISTQASSKKPKAQGPYVRSSSSEPSKRKKKSTLYNITALMEQEREDDEVHVLRLVSKGDILTAEERTRRDPEGDASDWENPRKVSQGV